MKVGDIVTITVKHPAGVEEYAYVLNETGVITAYDREDNCWVVETGKPETSGWWFDETEFRPATAEEIAERLRYVLMDRN